MNGLECLKNALIPRCYFQKTLRVGWIKGVFTISYAKNVLSTHCREPEYNHHLTRPLVCHMPANTVLVLTFTSIICKSFWRGCLSVKAIWRYSRIDQRHSPCAKRRNLYDAPIDTVLFPRVPKPWVAVSVCIGAQTKWADDGTRDPTKQCVNMG